MFDKKQVQNAIREIDANLALLNGSRQVHTALAKDVQLVQAVCMDYFEGKKEDERANEPTVRPKLGDKDK